MLNFIYSFYFIKFKSNFIDNWYLRIFIRLVNFILPIYFNLFSSKNISLKNNSSKKQELFIVSLTSFPARINKVWLTIETILRQKEKPDRVLLWLYKGEFNGNESLHKSLLKLEKRGLEIHYCDENLMPHNKYYYTLMEYPQANIITIDDDMLYPPDLICKLKQFHKKYPTSVICPITRKIQKTNTGIRPYKEWKYLKNNSEPSLLNLTMGVGSALYPPNSLHSDVLVDKNNLTTLALKADDLWLKIMSLKQYTKVVSIAGEYPRFFIPIINENNISLTDSNIGLEQNDKIFKNLIKHYQIVLSLLKE